MYNNEDEDSVLFGSSIIFNIYTHSLLLGIYILWALQIIWGYVQRGNAVMAALRGSRPCSIHHAIEN